MKQFIETNLRHLFTGFPAFIVGLGIMSREDADALTASILSALTILVLRLILWVAAKYGLQRYLPFLTQTTKVIVIGALSAVMCLGLNSCTQLADLTSNMSASVFYRHPDTGAKGGLQASSGSVRPWFKMPIIDKDGNVVGEFEVDSAK